MASTCIHTLIQALTFSYLGVNIQIHAYMCACSNICTCHAPMHVAFRQASVYIKACMLVHAVAHTHIHTPVHIHTLTHTHTHTHTHI